MDSVPARLGHTIPPRTHLRLFIIDKKDGTRKWAESTYLSNSTVALFTLLKHSIATDRIRSELRNKIWRIKRERVPKITRSALLEAVVWYVNESLWFTQWILSSDQSTVVHICSLTLFWVPYPRLQYTTVPYRVPHDLDGFRSGALACVQVVDELLSSAIVIETTETKIEFCV